MDERLPAHSRQVIVRLAESAYRHQALRTLDRRLAVHMHHVISRQSQRLDSIANGFEEAQAANTGIAAETNSTASSLATIERTAADVQQRSATGSQQLQQVASSAAGAQTEVTSLREQTRHISGILGAITDLAGQTNILALNATIEAARAGEAGKGFAVVAQEVKSLSKQTHQAAETIEASIQKLNRVVDQVASVVTELGQTTSAVATEMHELSKRMDDMHGLTTQADQGTQRLAQTSEHFSQLFEELQAHLREASAGLQSSVAMIAAGEAATTQVVRD